MENDAKIKNYMKYLGNIVEENTEMEGVSKIIVNVIVEHEYDTKNYLLKREYKLEESK